MSVSHSGQHCQPLFLVTLIQPILTGRHNENGLNNEREYFFVRILNESV